MSGPRIHERVAFRIGRNTGYLTEIQIRRQLQRFDSNVVRNLGHDELRGERRDGEREDAGCKLNDALHVSLLISPPSSSAWRAQRSASASASARAPIRFPRRSL